ncbi:BamA/OMP85 family outer membrane protein [Anatilimnocola aggregata]|uniref:BamA/OMP85 family outer membrane protein n=1 Tax=Anatilimnocola aggregata TaxID=2528021 RepID=UPI0011A822E9|nr:BamA/TamA family outer membrane protein [Anatilimnocola aggregata]
MTLSPQRRMLWTRPVRALALVCGWVACLAGLSNSASGQYQDYPPAQPYGNANPYLAAPSAPQPGYSPQAAPPGYAPPAYGQPSYPQPNYGQPTYGQPTVASAPTGGFASPNPYLQPNGPTTAYQPGASGFGPPPMAPGVGPSGQPIFNPSNTPSNLPSVMPTAPEYLQPPPNTTPLDVFVEETRTGRFMFGVAVNSDAGVTGQITIDERNFDYSRTPDSWDDFANGTAWRGAGQGFRLEAQPGSQVQRYLVSFTEPYFMNSNVSFSASAFYFDRGYYDYSESRYGGRLAWGYRLTPDMSITGALRAENINIFNPRVNTVPELNAALGTSDLFSGKVSLTHDTRDLPFMPTEGHMIEMSFEQAFGSYDFPKGEVNWYQYFMLHERPDGSGRHTIAVSSRVGFSGSQTPIFENYFAGGFSTMRGFAFRGASPIENGVRVGGEFQFLNSVEYFFPLTADDMVKGTVFVDFGTVERDIAVRPDNFRVAPGFGLRINVPALGPAPLALDFAFPVASATGDEEQLFSFFFGLSRQ